MSCRRIFILIAGFFLCATLPAQNSVDSLLQLLKGSKGEERINILLQLAGQNIILGTQGPDYAEQALNEALASGNSSIIGKTYYECGKIYNQKGEDEIALNLFRESLTANQKAGDREGSGDALLGIANSLNILNQADKAIEPAEKALQTGNDIKNFRIIGSAYYHLGNSYYNQNNFEKALEYHEKSLEAREKAGDNNDIAASLNRLGILYYTRAEFKKAVEYYKRVIAIRTENNDTRGAAIALLNLGNANFQMGSYDSAINNYKKAYDSFRLLDYKRGIASTLNGIAVIYEAWSQYPSALEAYKEMLSIQEELGDEKEIANAYSNIGIIYILMGTDSLQKVYGKQFRDSIITYKNKPRISYFDEGIRYNQLALEKRRKNNDIKGIGTSIVNLGNAYHNTGDLAMARKYFQEWLSLADEIQDNDQQVSIYMSLGQIYHDEGNYEMAIQYNNRAYELATKIDKKSNLRLITLNLGKGYEATGDYRKALAYFKESNDIQESLLTEESQKIIHEMQVKYETDLLLADQKLKDAEIRQKNNAIYFFIFIIVAFLAFVILLIRQNNQRKKANQELARKNLLITEQKKEITDSIQYASRIQSAILPPDSYIDKLLPDRFITFRPRDIVSGDYYWFTERDDKIITMTADCTGHGVPGAFMSLLGISFLNEIISKNNAVHTDEILNELRSQVIDSLHQTGKEGENQDGMDVAFYIIDRKNNTLEYSGANNPLYLFRDGELIEFKSDNMPIGIHKNAGVPFTRHEYKLKKNDVLYTFSDGYADQFGGVNGKKFLIKNLKKLFFDIHDKPMKEQKVIIEKTLDEWMNGTNQIDDILVMGVRV